jgi:large subunit ribosomal protein L4
MPTIPIYTAAGEQTGDIALADDIFGIVPHRALMHQAVVTTLANRRQGSADTKTRGEVHHTTKKLFKQKGTGRARQGMRSAPHWKGGGIVFGPHPRDYSLSLPKKMKRQALLSALSVKAGGNAIVVVEDFGLTVAKTRNAVALLQALHIQDKRVLVVLTEVSAPVVLSFSNLPNINLITVEMLGTYDVLKADCLLFTRSGIERLTEIKQQPLGIARWMAKQAQEVVSE